MKKLFIFSIVFQLTINSFSQDEVPSASLNNNVVFEKVYLHIDREAYAPQEDIWFKIYLVSGISNKLIQGYKNVYVELLNDSGMVVDDRLILVINGVAQGDFSIPGDISEGQYTIRAFTEYLKNFGEESFFHKKIWIAKMLQQRQQDTETDHSEIDLGFYPEGGNLILNASNTIAFKAINRKGYGIPVEGFIINDLGDTITPFETSFMGMGRFALMPGEGRSYKAILKEYPDFSFTFTEIQPDGITLKFRDEISIVKLGIARNFSDTNSESLQLVASHKGIKLFNKNILLNTYYHEIEISKEKFPLGISKISLISANGKIVAERLIFIKADNLPEIEVNVSGASFNTRSKVELQLKTNLGENDSIEAGVSVSVINRNYLQRNGYLSDIRGYLLLDSELKGPIEASAAFFTDEGGISSSEKLDLLMLVHGWRTYYWPEIIKKEPSDLKGWDDIGISVKGHVKKLFKDVPIEEGRVILGPISSGYTFLESLTNEEGIYQFDRLFLRDSSRLIIQARTTSGTKRTEVFIDDIYTPEKRIDLRSVDSVILDPIVPKSYYSMNFTKLEAERRYAIESGSNWLEEVKIVSNQKSSLINLTEEADRTYGRPDRRFVISDDDMSYFNILDYLEAKLPGVVIEGDNISIRGGQTPAILLDDIINDLVDISTIPIGDIDHVDIFMTGIELAAFGSRGADGVIAIYTKKGALNVDFQRYVKGRVSKVVDGFQSPRKFYSPKYTMENIKNEIPDYRPTLYWNPFVDFENRTSNIAFFTSDFVSRYLVVIEGISANGVICTGIGKFDVIK